MCIKFNLNGLDWEVYLKGQSDLHMRRLDSANSDNDDEDDEIILGLTLKDIDEVWLWDKINKEPLLYRTIKHELTHAFVDSYGFGQFKEFNEENLADFVECYADSIIVLAKRILAEVTKGNSNDK